jgi:hypothetical protein
MRILKLAGPIAALAALPCGCEAVPTLTFLPPGDAAASDTIEETRPPADAGLGGCADPDSGQTYMCCGAVACAGALCNATVCNSCSKCTPPDEYCCANPNNPSNVACKTVGTICR